MSNQETDVDKYLKPNSYLRQWVNECVCCHYKGYKPQMPEPKSFSTAHTPVKLRRLLDELALDEMGLCEQCQAAFSDNQKE
ncbi:MAG: hypothetical protein JNM09_18985 [Blastocatellia bacterium]|nr:hypothetical protein [Blastocatellia bacterium]